MLNNNKEADPREVDPVDKNNTSSPAHDAVFGELTEGGPNYRNVSDFPGAKLG